MVRVNGAVLVTGLNRGIGLEMTPSLLNKENVTKVYAGSRNRDKSEMLRSLADPNGKLRILELDVSKDSSIKSAAETVAEESKHLNLLINNAAILENDHRAVIIGGERSSWLRHFDVNVVSSAMMIQECLPFLQKAEAKNESATILNIIGRKGSIELCPGTERLHGNYANMCTTFQGLSDPSKSAPIILDTIDGMTIANDSGKYLDRKGRTIPY
uniref:NAD(P)-binding protein n=1 Tax=Angiostrongylus cantonensis TaxID=6313 RepID=A0A0K0DHA4_ANGCA